MRLLIFLLLLLPLMSQAYDISISLPQEAQNDSPISLAVQDAQELLKKSCLCKVSINDSNADVQLILPKPQPNHPKAQSIFIQSENINHTPLPNASYQWQAEGKKLTLTAYTSEGITAAIYGLMQEGLGFQFYHPREMIFPDLSKWPLPNNFSLKAQPNFEKRAFHIHMQHPLELTEYLHNPDLPYALDRIKEYIDWLARNQQNVFQFLLLESVDLPRFIPHAKAFVEYAHQRGILVSVDLSLHSVQQKYFQLYRSKLYTFKSKRKQIRQRMQAILSAGFDFMNTDLSTAEFVSANEAKQIKIRKMMLDMGKELDVPIMTRKHVVSDENEFKTNAEDQAEVDDSYPPILHVHTVMFYSVSDEKAKVYENENLQHMLSKLQQEKTQREVWYFPETAYWVTFDNSVPMWLMPYFTARHEDIETMVQEDVVGHITFSSGWEWGYWWFDWSVARWSWQFEKNEKTIEHQPLEYVYELFPEKDIQAMLSEALDLQEEYLKDKELMRYLVPQSVMDELPAPLDLQFHPRPEWKYAWIWKDATTDDLEQVYQEAIVPLLEFADQSEKLVADLEPYQVAMHFDGQRLLLFQEILDGLAITGHRARHRAFTLSKLMNDRYEKLTDQPHHFLVEEEDLVESAEEIRGIAQIIVKAREEFYRYDVDLIGRKHWEHSSYHFGYLYPVSELHFWRREEAQVKRKRFDPLLMNIWNIPRIIGLID